MSDHTIRFGGTTLTIDISERDSEVEYVFKGDVDEHFRQKDVPRVKRPTIILSLEDVSNFNSCGIREWIYLIRDIGELGKLKFRRCSVAMIESINLVPDTLGKGSIESFFGPYYCSCGGETVRLIDMNTHKESIVQRKAPAFNCEKCGKPLEFDAIEDSYFLFMNTSGKHT